MERHRSFFAGSALALVLLTGPAAAGADAGERILRLMDAQLTSADNQYFEYEMTTRTPGRGQRSTVFEVTIQGDQRRRLEFLAPGDVKGMRVLILSLDRMYVYLPAYRKVRRVASHVRDQGFMGSAFSHDDMSVVTYADKLSGRLLAEDDEHWTVEAVRRADSDYRYAKLRLVIRRDIRHPARIEYFNAAGQKVKTETRSAYECRGQHCNPKRMTLVDHTRGGVTSVLERRAWKIEPEVPANFFSVRSLQRRR